MPVHLVDHPVVQDSLGILRTTATGSEAFRREALRISRLLVTEALRDLPLEPYTVDTPLGPAQAGRLVTDVVAVPVLRAGLAMLDPLLELVPRARVGHIGLQRDESTAVASRYYAKLPPELTTSRVVVLDPMLATGGSAIAAFELLREAGARHLRIVCVVAAPEGVAAVEQAFPDVVIYTPVVDRGLNPRKFIVPGLGDFGDRLYGTS